jgi:Aldehyde dehydrogenase family
VCGGLRLSESCSGREKVPRKLQRQSRFGRHCVSDRTDATAVKFIGGKFAVPRAGKYFDSINPATEEKLAEIAAADAHDVDRAVKSARRAYKNVWSKMAGRERGKFLYRIARLIQEKSRELAVLRLPVRHRWGNFSRKQSQAPRRS